MTVKIIKEKPVTRPEPEPLKSTLLDHTGVVQLDSFGLRNNEGLWPSYNCLDTNIPAAYCPEEFAASKQFSRAEWQPGMEFGVYAGTQCSAVGLDMADQERETYRVFERNASKGVEQAILANRFVVREVESDDPQNIAWAGPVLLTPAQPVSPQVALAIAEGYAAATYAGVPTLHMPRAMASLLNERIVWEGDLAYTRSGSKVAIGGGYDAPGVPDNTWDIYVTGEVYVERSSEVTYHQHVIPGDGSGVGSDENGLEPNTVITLAERLYRVAIDCMVAKVTATVWTV